MSDEFPDIGRQRGACSCESAPRESLPLRQARSSAQPDPHSAGDRERWRELGSLLPWLVPPDLRSERLPRGANTSTPPAVKADAYAHALNWIEHQARQREAGSRPQKIAASDHGARAGGSSRGVAPAVSRPDLLGWGSQ